MQNEHKQNATTANKNDATLVEARRGFLVESVAGEGSIGCIRIVAL
jgi:hypothetical protein